MWLFCKSGFFSAVKHNSKPNTIHVRARFKGDIERLCQKYDVKPNVVETIDGDYSYRMDFEQKVWAIIVTNEAMDIDYTNFKHAVHDGTPRDFAYLGVWSAMRRAQQDDYQRNLRINKTCKQDKRKDEEQS